MKKILFIAVLLLIPVGCTLKYGQSIASSLGNNNVNHVVNDGKDAQEESFVPTSQVPSPTVTPSATPTPSTVGSPVPSTSPSASPSI